MAAPLWQPSEERILGSNLADFMEAVEKDWNVTVDGFSALYRFSVEEKEKFWQSLRDYAGIIAETWGDEALVEAGKMPGARWFPGARLNFAENLLRRRDGADAIVFWAEDRVRRRLSYAELYHQISRAGTRGIGGPRVRRFAAVTC